MDNLVVDVTMFEMNRNVRPIYTPTFLCSTYSLGVVGHQENNESKLYFPMHQQQQVRMQLSVNLLGVLSQTLIKRKDGRGRIAAFEVMVFKTSRRLSRLSNK